MHSNATHSSNCSVKKQSDWKRPSITRRVYLYTTGWKFACQGETDVKLPSHIMGFTVSCARARIMQSDIIKICDQLLTLCSVPHFNGSQFWEVLPHYFRWYSSLCEVNHYSRADHLYTNVGLHYHAAWIIVSSRFKIPCAEKTEDKLLNGLKAPRVFCAHCFTN